jgi:hypothetical protein
MILLRGKYSRKNEGKSKIEMNEIDVLRDEDEEFYLRMFDR